MRSRECHVHVTWQDMLDSRLIEDTFTSEEVEEMISGMFVLIKRCPVSSCPDTHTCPDTGLRDVVSGDMATELIHTSHTHSLLVAQLLQQAEKWHLTMKADISALENK